MVEQPSSRCKCGGCTFRTAVSSLAFVASSCQLLPESGKPHACCNWSSGDFPLFDERMSIPPMPVPA